MRYKSKKAIITNLIMIACALAITLCVMMLPLRVVAYEVVVSPTFGDGNIVYEDTNDDETDVTYHYVTIEQSVWKIWASNGFDEFDLRETQKQLSEYKKEIESELDAWELEHSDATNEEVLNASADIVAEKLSNINYLGYVRTAIEAVNTKNELYESLMGSITTTMVFAYIYAVFTMFIAILSAIEIIMSVKRMIDDDEVSKIRYLHIVAFLLGIGQLGMLVSPFMSGFGAPFITLMMSLAACFGFALGRKISGDGSLSSILICSAVNAINIAIFVLLCFNVMGMKITYTNGEKITINAPAGYGALFSDYVLTDAIHNSKPIMYAAGIPGLLYYLTNCVIAPTAMFIAMLNFLRKSYAWVRRAHVLPFLLVAVGFFIAGIIVVLGGSGAITSSILKDAGVSSPGYTVDWQIRAPMWIAVSFTAVMTVLYPVFYIRRRGGRPVYFR